MALFGASFALSIVLNIPFVPAVLALGVLATNLIPGGAREVWRIGVESQKIRAPGFELDLLEKITWFTIIFHSIVETVRYFTTDQLYLQRAFSAKSRRDAVLAGIANGIILVPVMLLLWIGAIALFAFYSQNPALTESLMGLTARGIAEPADGIVPHFIVTQLHPVLAGLIVAGIFAATMSSVDSGINSLTTVCVMDYYRRFFHKPAKTEGHLPARGALGHYRVGRDCYGGRYPGSQAAS